MLHWNVLIVCGVTIAGVATRYRPGVANDFFRGGSRGWILSPSLKGVLEDGFGNWIQQPQPLNTVKLSQKLNLTILSILASLGFNLIKLALILLN